MGEVWEVVHPETQVHYALKVMLRPDAIDDLRFEREAQALASLSSPHVVRVHSAGLHQGSPYLVQEFLTRGSLADRLRQGPLAPNQARQIVAEIATGVAAAHAAGILHRDLKPDNVLFGEAGLAKVADFGLARREGDVRLRLTQTGEILGTPNYMAPEQAVDSSRADARADVYALGAILYATLTGGPPIPAAGRGLLAHLSAIQHEQPLPPSVVRPGLPADLDALCLAALEKDRDDRVPTVEAFLERLQGQPAPPPRQGKLLWGGGLLTLSLVVVVVVGLWATGQSSQPPPLTPPPSSPPVAASPTPTSTRKPKRRRSTSLDLQLPAWKGRTLSCLARGREFLVQGAGTLSRWDANSGELLEVVQAFPKDWDSRVLCDLPQGGLLAASQDPSRLGWYSPTAGVYRTTSPPTPSALLKRPGGGVVIPDRAGGVTFLDTSGQVVGARHVIFGEDGFRPPGRDPIGVMEIRALSLPRPDRLLLIGSPSEEQFAKHFKGSAITGWTLLYELRGTVPIALLASLESPGAKSLAYSPASGTLLIGKAVGSIDILAIRDGPKGPASHLEEVRRNLWSPSPERGKSTSWGEVVLLPGERHFLALGSGFGAEQNLLMSCEVVMGNAEPKIERVQLPHKPISLAVCFETRSALVCGLKGMARLVPFEELRIPSE